MAGRSAMLRATVKAVLSGDTVVLYGAPSGNSRVPVEREVSLAHVAAPRLGRANGDRPDEPYAWQSRERLRGLIIGQPVSFRIEYTVAQINREFASIHINNQCVNEVLIQEGLAAVRPLKGDEPTELYHHLVSLQSVAEAAKLGMWAKDGSSNAVRTLIQVNMDEPARPVYERLKAEPRFAVVEQVTNGATFRLTVLPCFDRNYHNVMVHLSGVQCPIARKGDTSSGDDAQPFSVEAKFFSESRLLHRLVKVYFEYIDKQHRLFGSLLVPQGNISEELLKAGLGKVADWSMGYTRFAEKLRAAERVAKEKRLNLFRDYQPPAVIEGMREFRGTVAEVISADTLSVAIDATGETEVKVHFSSTRGPRFGRKGETSEAYAWEARECLRKKCIGATVLVKIDYQKTMSDQPDTIRKFATVTQDGLNLAEYIIGQGFATVQRHSAADEQRSVAYDSLLRAEAAAKEKAKGMWSKGESAKMHLNDLTGGKSTLAKAKQMLPHLHHAGRTQAIVQFIMNGARFVLWIPKESCLLLMNVSGVRAPRASGKDGPGEAFGDDALAFARRFMLQRAAEVVIENVDKAGSFLGHLFINKKDYSVMLLQQGLATVTGRPTSEQEAAEEVARQQKLGLWKNYDESAAAAAAAASAAEAAEAENEQPMERRKEPMDVIVSDVSDGRTFHVQRKDTPEPAALTQALASMPAEGVAVGAFDFQVGGICAAQFSVDNVWYRARLLGKQGNGFLAYFIDYGNREVVPLSRLHPLPAGLEALPPRAMAAELAYLKVPAIGEDFGTEAAERLSELAFDKPLLANVEARNGDVLSVMLYDVDGKVSIQELMLRSGLARIKHIDEPALQELMEELETAQEYARRAHHGIWYMGDVADDDEEAASSSAASAHASKFGAIGSKSSGKGGKQQSAWKS